MAAQDKLTRQQASDAVEAIGWRYLLGTLSTTVGVASLAEAARLAATVIAACGPDADAHLRLDLRPDRVEVSLQTRAISGVTQRDVDLARQVTDALGHAEQGPRVVPARPVQSLEVAIDALDIPAIRPFWQAVLGYTGEPGREAEADSLVDPAGQLPNVWFQQMDSPREQRNRIHFDLTVAHDEAERRIAAALAAGGRVVDDSHARSFWILADAEGNEICVCTWQDRDGRQPLVVPTDG